MPDLPTKVTIYEVGPRDGLQNEAIVVPTEAKAEFIRRLEAAGLPIIELTSFVHPCWVPNSPTPLFVGSSWRTGPPISSFGA